MCCHCWLHVPKSPPVTGAWNCHARAAPSTTASIHATLLKATPHDRPPLSNRRGFNSPPRRCNLQLYSARRAAWRSAHAPSRVVNAACVLADEHAQLAATAAGVRRSIRRPLTSARAHACAAMARQLACLRRWIDDGRMDTADSSHGVGCQLCFTFACSRGSIGRSPTVSGCSYSSAHGATHALEQG